MRMKKCYVLIWCLCWLFSCRESDEKIIIDTEDPKPPTKLIQTNIIGIVLDPGGNPIAGAEVSLGGIKQFTDLNGFYRFKDVYINDLQDYLFVSAQNYFDGIEPVDGFAGDTSFRRIALEEKVFTNSFSSESDALFNFGNLYEVSIPANSLLTESGSPFSGKYRIAPAFRNEQLVKHRQTSYFSLSDNGQNKLLRPDNLLGIEVRSFDSGELLHFSKKIGFKYSPNSPNPTAAKEIYYYDKGKSVWKFESRVIFNNGSYQFETIHPEKLCLGEIHEFVSVTGVLESKFGNPLSFVNIGNDFMYEQLYTSRSTISGKFKLYCLKNEPQKLNVLTECNQIIYSTDILGSDQNLVKNISLTTVIPFYSEISGAVLQCDGSSNIEGYILVSNNEKNYLVFPIRESGQYTIKMIGCNEEDNTLTAVDTKKNVNSLAKRVNIYTNGNLILKLCDEQMTSLARFSFNMTDTVYSNCRVRKISNSSAQNIIYIFEYGNKGLYTEKLILEKLINSSGGFNWRMTHFSFIQNNFKLKELIEEPDFYLFNENGIDFMECSLPKVIIENDFTKEKFLSDIVFFRAVII